MAKQPLDVPVNFFVKFNPKNVKKLLVYGRIFESGKIYSISSLDRDVLLNYSFDGENPFKEFENNNKEEFENVTLVV